MIRFRQIPLNRIGDRVRYWTTVGVSCVPPNRYRSIFVLGYPRTGTNWLCRMLSSYFEIPISQPWLRTWPEVKPVILHLHRFAIVPRRTIYMIRDPRDILISYYHKVIANPEHPMRALAARYCEAPLVHENLRTNLAGYVRVLFDESQTSAIPIDRHFRKARGYGLFTARYEDLLERGKDTLTKMVEYLSSRPADPRRVRATLEATSFEAHTGRRRGQEDLGWAVARKGVAGDWRNQFTPEAARVFHQYAGDLLIESGYEQNHDWVEAIARA
jgi:hypothetical protein